MNRLSTDKRTAVIAALVEGTSVNATCRMTGVAKHTVLNLLKDIGCACAAYHNANVRNLRVRRVQADEIWSFVGAKQKNVTAEHKAAFAGPWEGLFGAESKTGGTALNGAANEAVFLGDQAEPSCYFSGYVVSD